MKKTFLTMLMAGSSMVMFAQTVPTTTPTSPTTPATTPTTTPTTSPVSPTTTPTTNSPVTTNPTSTSPVTNSPVTSNPTTTYPTTSPTNGTSTSPMNGTSTSPINGTSTPMSNQATTNGSVTNSTTDPMNTVTNPSNTVTNPSLNNNAVNGMNNTTNYGAWGAGASTTPPSWNWGSYGIWDPSVSPAPGTSTMGSNTMNANSGVTGSTTPSTSTDMNASTGYSNSNSYSAYSPTSNVMIPWNVQMNYSKEYPTASAAGGTWSQYGDWFYSTYQNNGRNMQIFYDQRGNGYSLALPVLNTYVPEEVVSAALQRYGSSLYSITMIKGTDSVETYQIGLLHHGQMKTEWLHNDGASVMNVYRSDDMNTAEATMGTDSTMTTQESMNTTDSNAAMNANQSMDQSTKHSKMSGKKEKTVIKHEDGSKTKIKSKNGNVKVKEVPATTPVDQMNNQ